VRIALGAALFLLIALGACEAQPQVGTLWAWTSDRSPERLAEVNQILVEHFQTAEMPVLRHIAELGDPIAQEVLLARRETGPDAEAAEAERWRARVRPLTPESRRRFINESIDSFAQFIVARGEDGHPVMYPMLRGAPTPTRLEPEVLFELPEGCHFLNLLSFDPSGRYVAAEGTCGPFAILDLSEGGSAAKPKSDQHPSEQRQGAFARDGALRWLEGYSSIYDPVTGTSTPIPGVLYELPTLLGEPRLLLTAELGATDFCAGSFTNAWALATQTLVRRDEAHPENSYREVVIATSDGGSRIHRQTLPYAIRCNMARVEGQDRVVVVDAARAGYAVPANGVILIDPSTGASERRPFRFGFGAPYPVHNAKLHLDAGGRSTLGVWDLAANQGGAPRWGGAERMLIDIASGEISPFLFSAGLWPIVGPPGTGLDVFMSCMDRCRVVFHLTGKRIVVLDVETRTAICVLETSFDGHGLLAPNGDLFMINFQIRRQAVARWRLPEICPQWGNADAD
jgi:hypothetical protein